ncbi:hypothetical protein PIROE2DRAFT_1118 [Piromyces sp. E2]|nr:hypothetical protein PIROE2DRAFT_1118 [Piromyces sp. E2]|eukprot:OUM70597.1 hypothetical protein PIROE2DRAFT_1118 [Piromyces sp. E2]
MKKNEISIEFNFSITIFYKGSSLNKFKTQIGYLQQQIEMIIHELYLLTFKLNECIQRHIVILNKQEEKENFEIQGNSLILIELEQQLMQRIFYILTDAEENHGNDDKDINKINVNNKDNITVNKNTGNKNSQESIISRNNDNKENKENIENNDNNTISDFNNNKDPEGNDNNIKNGTHSREINIDNNNTNKNENTDINNTNCNHHGSSSDRSTTKFFENWKDVFILIKNEVNKLILSEERQEVSTQGLSEGKQNYMDIIDTADDGNNNNNNNNRW